MANSLDLNILPIVRIKGQDQPKIPGLIAVTPPRRTARGRSSDNLILYLALTGNAPLAPEQYRSVLTRLTQTYFKTSGSITSAMRVIAESLNKYLLERNLRSSSAGRQGIGLLAQAVLRDGIIYLAHSGPVHTFVITPKEFQHLVDPQGAGRGLGLSRTTTIRYYQAKIDTGDFLIFTDQPPSGWNVHSLGTTPGSGLEYTRRRLLDRAPADLNAVLIQAQTGTGKLRMLRRKAALEDMASPAPVPTEPKTVSPTETVETSTEVTEGTSADFPQKETEPQEDLAILLPATFSEPEPEVAQVETTPEEAIPLSPPAPEEPEGQVEPGRKAEVEAVSSADLSLGQGNRGETVGTTGTSQPQPAQEAPPPRERHPLPRPSLPRISFAPLRRVLIAFTRALDNTFGRISRGLGSILKSILPDESTLSVSPSVLIFIAVAVPVVISTIGGVMYLQRGRAEQHQVYYQQAYQAAQGALAISDPVAARDAWETTIEHLDKAEVYAQTDESQAMRAKAQAELDSLDGIERLDFVPPIVGGLGEEIQISRMVANDNELYMLNAAQGTVMRAVLKGQGYEIDPNFICGPSYGPIIVGPLIDIVALPKGSIQNATVLGMDANGNLLYCIPGEQPLTAPMTPPDINFGSPTALTLNMDDVYILDPPKNAVWIYRNLNFTQQPRLFFGDQIPPMQDVIDIAVNNDDLYMLHADGHVTMCTYTGLAEAPTRCVDPVTYADPRPGRQDGPVIPDALFSQIFFSPPPDPSIYMLDPDNQAIYHFSLRMALQRQFRSANEMPEGLATAFAVGPSRIVFIAIGNEVFHAALP
jgi:hypothetical protein